MVAVIALARTGRPPTTDQASKKKEVSAMTDRVFSPIARILYGAGQAIRTPSGVHVDLLRAYGPLDENGLAHLYGGEIPPKEQD